MMGTKKVGAFSSPPKKATSYSIHRKTKKQAFFSFYEKFLRAAIFTPFCRFRQACSSPGRPPLISLDIIGFFL